MSFFKKGLRNTGRFFNKQTKPLARNFFRKGGGIEDLSRGLRQSSNVLKEVGSGVSKVSKNPLVLAGGTALGTYMGNPLLGVQLAGGGSMVGSGLEGAGEVLGGLRTLTNRNKYMSKKQIQREEAREKRNELEKSIPKPPISVPIQPIMAEPVFGIPQEIQAPSRSVPFFNFY